MRQLIGVGTPRALQRRLVAVMAALLALMRDLWGHRTAHRCLEPHRSLLKRRAVVTPAVLHFGVREMALPRAARALVGSDHKQYFIAVLDPSSIESSDVPPAYTSEPECGGRGWFPSRRCAPACCVPCGHAHSSGNELIAEIFLRAIDVRGIDSARGAVSSYTHLNSFFAMLISLGYPNALLMNIVPSNSTVEFT